MILKIIEYFRISGRYKKTVPFIITFVAVLIAYILPKAEILTLIIFVILIVIFSVYRFDARILIAYAILLLVIAGALTFQKSEYSQSQVAILSYWLVSAGVIFLIIDLYRRRKSIGVAT
jgi:hypothetical protein